MDLIIRSADAVNVTPETSGHGKYVKAEIEGVSILDILDQIPIKEAIEYYSKEKLLDEIGEDEAIVHFKLGREEEQ